MSAEIDVLETLEDLRDSCPPVGAARHLQVEGRIDAPILLNAVVVQVPEEADVGAEGEDALALGMEAAHEELLGLAHVDARNVPQVSAESLGAVDEVGVVEPLAVLVEEVEVVGRAAALGAIEIASLAGHRLAGKCPGIVELEARIERGDAVVAAGELAIGEEHAEVRFAEFALHSDYADLGAAAVVGIGGIECGAGGAVVDGQHAEVPAAQLAGDAAAEFG